MNKANTLYYVKNIGCDATTRGIVCVSSEDFDKFKAFIENLNKNSYYGCMPVISVYRIKLEDLHEINYNPKAEIFDDDYVDKSDVLYLNGKTYVFANEELYYSDNLERVI